MSSVVNLMICLFFTEIHGYHIIRNRSNDLYFSKEYFIIVDNKTILNEIYTKTFLNEMWYIYKYFINNIFPFLVAFN